MILIVDFGSQTAHLIGRRLRDFGVATEYCEPDMALESIQALKPSGVIFSGGPSSVYDEGTPTLDPKIFELGIPILGLCYGWQLTAHLLGGQVKNAHKEYGPEQLDVLDYGVGLNTNIMPTGHDNFTVIMSHGDTVTELPKGFDVVASTKSVKYAAVQDIKRHIYGLQFHPEVDHTEHGKNMLQAFASNICGEALEPLKLDPGSIIEDIKKQVGKDKVICAVSGGVDSTVAAFLIGKAIGHQLVPVYVESGLMREGTLERVQHLFTHLVEADLVVVQAKKRFMTALAGITDPEVKRKTIGKLYVDIFAEIAAKHKDAAYLGQGTIYSDVIESKGSKHASKIKSHHNVGGLPKDMKLKLLEPVRNFYKDEVRELGRLSGIPEEAVSEQPFPGPGYAIRVRGEVTEARLQQVMQADTIVVEEIKHAGMYGQVFQCFAVMTGAYSTAVKGDARAFAEVVALRAYESTDVMTSRWADIPYDVLQKISSRIVNEVPDVSRVVYDITTKPPATMEWE